MLSAPMPKMNANQLASFDKYLEDFAYTYWAQFNGAAIPSRVDTALKNAWGHTSAYLVARSAGAEPGYVVAIWNSPGDNRITVAIEGTTAISQLFPLFIGPQSVTATGLTGSVYGAFWTYAQAIKTKLLADATFMANFNLPGVVVTFAGFSLGAAVAEVLASIFEVTYPTKAVRCTKFASPRVGDAFWTRGGDLIRTRHNLYVGDDPIHTVPIVTTHATIQLGVALTTDLTSFAPNTNCSWRGVTGELRSEPEVRSLRAASRSAIFLATIGAAGNPWNFHDINTYRLAYTNLVTERGDHTLYRFRYCEYNNENSWGANFRQGTTSYAGLIVVAGSPPAPAVVDLPRPQMQVLSAPIVVAPRPQNPMNEVMGRDFDGPSKPPTWTPRRVRDY